MAGPYGLESAGSMQVNSQIVPVPMSGAFFPALAQAPYYNGSGQPPPTVALSYMQTGSGGTNQAAADVAASNPFSFVDSPLIIAVLALVIGILGLRYVHWRG